MPSIVINKKVFEKAIGKKIPLQELKDRISMLGTDLEKIEGNEIHVEIFPDRPDMLSEQGFARAFATFTGIKTGLRKYDVKPFGSHITSTPNKEWPFVLAAVVKGLKFDDDKIKDIIQVQEKLHTTLLRNRKKGGIGIYPLDKLKFPIRFTAEDPDKIKFRPLEYQSEITGRQILSKHPTGRAYAHTCEKWNKFPVFRDANNNILSMPPIINSHDTGKITEKTKDVFIEATGTDFDALQSCINIIVTTLADLGGKIFSVEMRYPNKKFISPNLKPQKMSLDIAHVNKLLGLDLTAQTVKKLLLRMGFGVSKSTKKELSVLCPAYRADILHPVDLIEDVAIAYGYENFKEEIPNVSTIGEEDPGHVFNRAVADIMIGLGLLELNTYHLTNEEVHSKKMNTTYEGIQLLNAQTNEYNVLRSWLLPCMMQVLSENKHHEYPQNLFNIGVIFKKNPKTETGVEENYRLGVTLCEKDADYTKIKQVLDVIMDAFQAKYDIDETEHTSFIPGRVGRVKVGSINVAYVGELAPVVISNFGLGYPVAALELNLTELCKIIRK